MSNTDSQRSFEMELEIAASTAAVWNALSTAEGLSRWFASQAKVTPGPDGTITWSWNEFFQWQQQVEVWEPGQRLRTRYDSSVDDGAGGKQPLFIEFTLEGRGDSSTVLRLVHSGFGPDARFDEEYDGISRGWSVELQSLRLYVENHLGRDRNLTWCSAPVAIDSKEAWARLAGAQGLGFGSRFDGARPGDAFSLSTREAGELSGVVLNASPQEVSARIGSHADAFLRLSADRCGGTTHVWLWLATYRPLPDADLVGLESTWNAMLQRLFPEQVAAGSVQPERTAVSKEN